MWKIMRPLAFITPFLLGMAIAGGVWKESAAALIHAKPDDFVMRVALEMSFPRLVFSVKRMPSENNSNVSGFGTAEIWLSCC